MQEKQSFEPDDGELTTPQEKNDALAQLLQGPWKKREIVRIERIEIGGHGWRVTYRIPD